MSLITPDFGLLVWMTLIFAIVFFILAKFGFPLITGMVDKRRERINDSIAKAQQAQDSLATLASQQEQLIKDAQAQQAQILRDAAQLRNQMIQKAREDAQEQAQKIVEQARVQIEQEKQNAMRDIRSQVSALSVEVASRLLSKDLSNNQEQLSLIDRLLDETDKIADKS